MKKFFETWESSENERNISYYVQYEDIPAELNAQLASAGSTNSHFLTRTEFANFLPHEMTGLWIGLGKMDIELK